MGGTRMCSSQPVTIFGDNTHERSRRGRRFPGMGQGLSPRARFALDEGRTTLILQERFSGTRRGLPFMPRESLFGHGARTVPPCPKNTKCRPLEVVK